MGWRLAESLKRLREQVNEAYPNRDKSSDGSIGDTSHSARKSDHNPNPAGVVTAIDIDADLSPSVNVGTLIAALRASRDPRIKYIIWRGQITVKGDISRLKNYTGPNGHFHHAHISVSSDRSLYDSRKDWNITGTETSQDSIVTAEIPATTITRTLEIGDVGPDVKVLQALLGLPADGEFGRNTKKAVINVQVKHGLRVDGIVGAATRKALGL